MVEVDAQRLNATFLEAQSNQRFANVVEWLPFGK